MDISFIQETGKKGEDYDLLARKNEMIIYAEAKSRRNGLILNENTLINALSAARKQLPKSGPGVIFIWIPVEWTQDVEAEIVISRAIISFFRNTQRVNTVILLWESWFDVSKGKAKAILVRQYDNPNPKMVIKLGKFVQPIEIGKKMDPSSFTPSFW